MKSPFRKIFWKILPAVPLLFLGTLAFFIKAPIFRRGGYMIETYIETAENLNIRNLVSAIYLGPRLLDTISEVLLVVATVFGMIFIRKGQ